MFSSVENLYFSHLKQHNFISITLNMKFNMIVVFMSYLDYFLQNVDLNMEFEAFDTFKYS